MSDKPLSPTAKREALDRAVKEIRAKYGDKAITKGCVKLVSDDVIRIGRLGDNTAGVRRREWRKKTESVKRK